MIYKSLMRQAAQVNAVDVTVSALPTLRKHIHCNMQESLIFKWYQVATFDYESSERRSGVGSVVLLQACIKILRDLSADIFCMQFAFLLHFRQWEGRSCLSEADVRYLHSTAKTMYSVHAIKCHSMSTMRNT